MCVCGSWHLLFHSFCLCGLCIFKDSFAIILVWFWKRALNLPYLSAISKLLYFSHFHTIYSIFIKYSIHSEKCMKHTFTD